MLCIAILFVVGFAFSFYILLNDGYYFSDPDRALMKVFVMMTGEFGTALPLPGFFCTCLPLQPSCAMPVEG